ncbi:amino acid adenylation domain-containing protein [Kitasatospora sp. NPDC001261]|uniref:non-ribosomal peptide synthetase n=1 Tax=Kitasatospora sp. NPDC001261 TaxID=3364012 RepID=UPI0036BDD52B
MSITEEPLAPAARTAPVDPMVRFRRAVESTPDRMAVRGTDRTLTFAELDQDVRQLAGRLAERGLGRGARVGVSMHRGADLVVALLAVWRIGAAYVPLDPAYPQERLTHMVTSAGLRTVLAEPGNGPAWPAGVDVLTLADALAAPAADAPAAQASPADPAYVIFTSGSTGTPKGVEATRGGVAALAADLEDAGFYADRPRVVAWNASISFDASVQQWARICRGDSIVVIGENERTDPAVLRALLDEHAVDDLDLTPSHWEVLREALLAPTADGRVLRLFMGGEPVPAEVWRELGEARAAGTVEAINLYGPTECTVDATAGWITGEGPHIGFPLPGFTAHVLDEHLRAAPVGEPGELYLAGPSVTTGYVGRPALTAQRFVADPTGTGRRMYRTGDRVRLRPDGAIDYLGRVDRQIKIRGYRVELGEIEAALAAHPGVRTAAVVLHGTATAGDQLVGYVVPEGGSAPHARELQEHLGGLLPSFMVPSAFVTLEAMPLSVNGKVDHRALPAVDEALWADGGQEAGDEPQGEFETLIAGVWSEVLGRPRISPTDNFFSLGGHSLIALRVIGRLKKQFGITVSTKEVYQHPELRGLAAFVESRRTEGK